MTYDKEKAKQYREEHKSQMKNYNEKYYSKNKEKIIKKLTTKTNCNLCGRVVNYCRLKEHQKLNICQNNRILRSSNIIQEKENKDIINDLKLLMTIKLEEYKNMIEFIEKIEKFEK